MASELELDTVQPSAKKDVVLEWSNITVKVNQAQTKNWSFSKSEDTDTKKRIILDDVSGEVRRGEMIALMGPSGAGKTTLLDILAGRSSSSRSMSIKGSVLLNGKKPKSSDYKKKTGYVKQEDLFIPTVTVKEALLFSAQLRLPKEVTTDERELIIDEVLSLLEIGHIATSYVGGGQIRGISGGEKKRTAIGVELVKKPDLLFLDEPTTGLDSSMAFTVTKILRKIADQNRSVICTIHQPKYSILKKFDKLMLLSGGRVAYFGPVNGAVDYFANLGHIVPKHRNPADFFLDRIRVRSNETSDDSAHSATKEEVDKLIEAYKTSPLHFKPSVKNELQESDEVVADNQHTFAVSWITQFAILFQRALSRSFRDPLIFGFELPNYLLMAIVMLMLYTNVDNDQEGARDRLAASFFSVLSTSLGPVFAVVVYFPPERAVFNRESSSGFYSVSAYYVATALSTFPIQFIGTVLLHLITYWAIPYRSGVGPFFVHYVILILGALISDALGLAISAAVPSVGFGNILAALTVLLWLNFVSFFVPNPPAFWVWAQYSSYLRYAVDAFLVNEFTGRTFTCPYEPCPIPDEYVTINNETVNLQDIDFNCTIPCQYSDGESVLKMQEIDDVVVWENIVVLIGFLIGFRLLGYLFLRFLKVGKS